MPIKPGETSLWFMGNGRRFYYCPSVPYLICISAYFIICISLCVF